MKEEFNTNSNGKLIDTGKYVCPHHCKVDEILYSEAGKCPNCNVELVELKEWVGEVPGDGFYLKYGTTKHPTDLSKHNHIYLGDKLI